MANRYFLNIGANWGDTANWSDTSGGTGGFSVPTNADDVFFDANSGNCTVNASNRVAKTLNFTGYTNTITMTFGITVSGSVTLVAAMTIAGAGTLTVLGTSTLTSNGKTWPNAFTHSQGGTITLADDLTISGLLSITGDTTTVNGTFNINANGGFSYFGAINQGTGTTTLNLLGGTWSAGLSVAVLRLNTVINGNITISGTVYYNTSTLTYTSGTVTTTGSTLNVGASTTLNTSGMSWNNVTFSATNTTTLTSNLNINGLLTISGTTTVNGSFNINASGGVTLSGFNIIKGTGTPKLYFKGGTVQSTSTSGRCQIDSYIDANITIGSILAFDTYSINYVSGIITNIANNSVYFLNTITGIDIGSNTLNNVFFQSGTNNYVITLNNNLTVLGLFTTTGGTVNGTYNINVSGGVTVILNGIFAQGTGITTLNLLAGTWSISGTGVIRINTVINGNITISGIVYYNTGTLTYLSGKTNANTATLNIGASSTFINCDKINFKTIIITEGTTQTFNRFFSGSAIIPTRIQSRIASNYTITFQDSFEKITKFTKISNCTISRPGQLLCITDKSNKGGNVGVRYINQMPNRVPLNNPSTANPIGYATSTYLLADPNTILN